jgi:hypothetical protein
MQGHYTGTIQALYRRYNAGPAEVTPSVISNLLSLPGCGGEAVILSTVQCSAVQCEAVSHKNTI